MRRVLAGTTAVIVLAGGAYVWADATDRVPGILTTAAQASPRLDAPAAPGQPALPAAIPNAAPALAALDPQAPVPSTTAVATALRPALGDARLGSSVSIVVRDGITGETLLSQRADRPGPIASVQKLLAAAAVGAHLDTTDTMTTKAVSGASSGEVILVAGGDTMLARGAGRPGEVEGHAGLADLAAQTVRSLKASGAPKRITVRLDASYARGPRYPSTWNMADVAGGFTQGVTMIGLAGQRPEPGKPSPARPEAEALTAFAAALTKAGIPATVTAHESTWATAAPKSATELGSVASAPIADVLGEALLHSDNALTENLVRQAAVAAGLSGDMKSAVTLMRRTLTDAKINTSGMVLRDASGLSSGQKVPARIVADVLTAGTEGELPGMAATIVQLPVGGYNGSLFDRFDESDSRAAAGVPRAKTGTLTGISGLAGTTITRDGRLLTYVIVADRNSDTLAARAALDRVVAQLTTLQSSKGRP